MKSKQILTIKEIKSSLQSKFTYDNIHQIPGLNAIVISTGFGKDASVKKKVDDLTRIAGQKAVATKAKASISNFGIREGMEVGAKVTLRRNRMLNFIYALRTAILNWGSFEGLRSNSISIVGNRATISLGIPDIRIFHEIVEFSNKKEGINITIISNCKLKEELQIILTGLGLPLKEKEYGI